MTPGRYNLDPELEAELEHHRREAMNPPTVLESVGLTLALVLATVLLLAGLAGIYWLWLLTL